VLPISRDVAVGVLSRAAGEGNRRQAVDGVAACTESSPAPSTTLRVVPLPRKRDEDPDCIIATGSPQPKSRFLHSFLQQSGGRCRRRRRRGPHLL